MQTTKGSAYLRPCAGQVINDLNRISCKIRINYGSVHPEFMQYFTGPPALKFQASMGSIQSPQWL